MPNLRLYEGDLQVLMAMNIDLWMKTWKNLGQLRHRQWRQRGSGLATPTSAWAASSTHAHPVSAACAINYNRSTDLTWCDSESGNYPRCDWKWNYESNGRWWCKCSSNRCRVKLGSSRGRSSIPVHVHWCNVVENVTGMIGRRPLNRQEAPRRSSIHSDPGSRSSDVYNWTLTWLHFTKATLTVN